MLALSVTHAGASDWSKDSLSLCALKHNIEKAYYTFDKSTLKQLLIETYELKNETGFWQTDYYAAILEINLGKIYYRFNEDMALELFEKAVDHLKQIEHYEQDYEILTLLSCAYGKISSLSGISAIYYGIKARDYIRDAYELEQNKPKLLLIAATHLMHTPESFGGSKEKAGAFLRKCLELNRQDHETAPFRIAWGQDAEIYAYLAQLELLQEGKEKALDYMKKALDIVPNYGFVLYDLQDQLDQLSD